VECLCDLETPGTFKLRTWRCRKFGCLLRSFVSVCPILLFYAKRDLTASTICQEHETTRISLLFQNLSFLNLSGILLSGHLTGLRGPPTVTHLGTSIFSVLKFTHVMSLPDSLEKGSIKGPLHVNFLNHFWLKHRH
jgi:hypothetical protein